MMKTLFFFLRLLALACLIRPIGAWPEAIGFYDEDPPDYADPLFRRSQELASRNRAFLSRKIRDAAEEALIEIQIHFKSHLSLSRTGFFVSENIAVTGLKAIDGLVNEDELELSRVTIKNFQGDNLKLKRIIALSAVHNLAVLEVEGYTGRPLDFASRSDFKDSSKDMLIAGVFKGQALWLRGKNASSRSFLWHWFSEALWIDPKSFESRGELAGSPALSADGKVMGLVLRFIKSNLVTGVRDKYILELLDKDPLPLKGPKALIEDELSRLKGLAESGDSFAQFEMARRLISRDGMDGGFEEGMRWLRRAAESGNETAMDALGMYLVQKYKEDHHRGGYELVSKAAAAGLPSAMHNLGVVLQNGFGAEKNEAEAIRWFEASAKLGRIDSQRKLAEIYFERRTHEDSRKALEWMFEGAAIGDPLLQYHAGMMFYKGDGVAENRHEALRWLILAGKSLPGAQYQLSEILSRRRGWANQFEALKWYDSSNVRNSRRPAVMRGSFYFPMPEDMDRSFILSLSRHKNINREAGFSSFEGYMNYVMRANAENYTVSPNWGIGSYGRELYNFDERSEPPEITFDQADKGYFSDMISRRRIQDPGKPPDIGNAIISSY